MGSARPSRPSSATVLGRSSSSGRAGARAFVYWIATRVRRDEGHGPTLIISPLLALIRNQIAMAGRPGLRAVTIHSGNKEEWAQVEQTLAADAVDVLLISPERLANEDFTTRVLPSIRGTLGPFGSLGRGRQGRGAPDGRRAVLDPHARSR
jgi:hypothetical protein